MKKLTRKFKEGFKNYDYNEQDIDVLLAILDVILEMMSIVDCNDHDHIKKLSSFTRLLSSGYSNTILEAAMIEEIYDTTILPILDYFDEKYSAKFVAISSKEIINGVPHTVVSTKDSKVLNISGEDFIDVQPFRDFLALSPELSVDGEEEDITSNSGYYRNENVDKVCKFIMSNKDTNDPDVLECIFNMTKDLVEILHNIYDSFTSGESRKHKERYIQDLVYICNTMTVVAKYDNTSIQLLSDVIQSICYSLIGELKNNDTIPPSSIMLIELKFRSVEDLKYEKQVIY